MFINESKVVQIVYENRGAVEIPPRFLFYSDTNRGVSEFVLVEDFQDRLKAAKRLVIQRTFGLGDTLMLVPIVRELREKYPSLEIFLATTRHEFRAELIEDLAPMVFDGYVNASYVTNFPYDIGVHLDGYIERDHTEKGFTGTHRVDLYRRFFGLEEGRKPFWGDPSSVGDGTILVHEGGNKDVKSFERETFEFLVDQLSQVADVVAIEKDMVLPGKRLAEVVRNAHCVVTFDTSPLWISHFTGTAVIGFFGPTSYLARVIYHPLYPKGVRVIHLDKEVGCKGHCEERMVHCDRKTPCMKVGKERVLDLVLSSLESLTVEE